MPADPGLGRLRAAALAMAATLASYGSALALDHAEHLGLGVVVLAVVLSLTLSRTNRATGAREWLLGLAVLSALAVAASEVGSLLIRHADAGDALFVLAIAGSIWIRRFGPTASRAGTLVALPFVALLITPAVPGGAHEHPLWAAVIGAIAYGWVSVAQTLGEHTGLLVRTARRTSTPSPARRPSSGRKLAASTRMALQMACALAASFALGRSLFGSHWPWMVLTAFIVCSGNRGRGDVVHKSALRIAGAVVGTVAATLISGAIAPASASTVVVIFIVLGLATWLRAFSYAYWAAGVTGVLALLYGYFGEGGAHLLAQRLEGIVLGALIAIAASWLLLPVRTTDVLRRRMADALAALGELLTALGEDPAELATRARRFEHALAALEEIAAPLEADRRVRRWLAGPRAHLADTIDAVQACREPVAEILGCLASDPDALRAPALADHRALLAAKLIAARRALAGRHEEQVQPAGTLAAPDRPAARSGAETAFAKLDAALTALTESYRTGTARGPEGTAPGLKSFAPARRGEQGSGAGGGP